MIIHPCSRCDASFASLLDRDVHSHHVHGTEPGETLRDQYRPKVGTVEYLRAQIDLVLEDFGVMRDAKRHDADRALLLGYRVAKLRELAIKAERVLGHLDETMLSRGLFDVPGEEDMDQVEADVLLGQLRKALRKSS